MVVNQPTYNLYAENQTVQDVLASTFSKTMKDASVNGIALSSIDDEIEINKEEFTELSRKMAIQSKELENEVAAATLVVIKPVLDESGNKWTFFKGSEKIQADIQDSDFSDKVINGECSFTSGDRLMVELLIRKEYSQQYRMYMPKGYSILKVKSHITGDEAVQMGMLQ